MSSHQPRPPRAAPDPTPPQSVSTGSSRWGEPEILALLAAALCVLHAWLGRYALNPDGVSYLDLARVAIGGDWPAFVQGYWSPLYPALIALVAMVAGQDPVSLVAIAHAVNGLAAVAAIGLLWWWSRQAGQRFLARALIATFLLVSSGLPRIEAVTPDVLLLALMTWLGYELLVRKGERAVLTGILLGAAYLAKTSAWPWLLAAVLVRLWGARDAVGRRRVWLSSAVGAVVMLTWIVPMSLEAGRPTLGSAGRLNYCWYIEACDSRTPDTHSGVHYAYQELSVDSTTRLGWAEYVGANRWTYAPWSDPTQWELGVQSHNASAPSLWQLLSYWGRQALLSFGLWLLPVLLAVLLPWYLLQRSPGMWRRLVEEDRPVLAVGLLGLAGVGQFILVHAEPRLIAPFGLLAALALLHQWSSEPTPARATPRVRQWATLLGLLVAAGYAVPRLRDGFDASARIPRVLELIASTKASLAAAGLSQDRIVILGPAIPVAATAFLSGARIAAQVPPGSLAVLKRLPTEGQRAALAAMFGGRYQVAWISTAEGTFTLARLPER